MEIQKETALLFKILQLDDCEIKISLLIKRLLNLFLMALVVYNKTCVPLRCHPVSQFNLAADYGKWLVKSLSTTDCRCCRVLWFGLR